MKGFIILSQDEIKKLYKTIKKWNDKSALLRYYSDKINIMSEEIQK